MRAAWRPHPSATGAGARHGAARPRPAAPPRGSGGAAARSCLRCRANTISRCRDTLLFFSGAASKPSWSSMTAGVPCGAMICVHAAPWRAVCDRAAISCTGATCHAATCAGIGSARSITRWARIRPTAAGCCGRPGRTWRRRCGPSSISRPEQTFCCRLPTDQSHKIHLDKYSFIMASLPDALRAPSWTCRNEALARHPLCLQA